MGGGMGMGYGMSHGMGPQGMFYGNPGAAVEGRLAALKSELKITSAQEGAWQAYAAQAKAQAESMQAAMTAMQGGTQSSAPERFALHNELMKQRVAQAEATNAAFKELYTVLTPEQRSIVDQGPVAGGPGFRGPGGRYR
jgi:Spy/CpxP family protein refolding chaperone